MLARLAPTPEIKKSFHAGLCPKSFIQVSDFGCSKNLFVTKKLNKHSGINTIIVQFNIG